MYRIGLTLLVWQLAAAAGPLYAQRTTVWNGVYTENQAAAGREAFRSNCSRCHGSSLDGGSAVALRGDFFMEGWREDTVASLFSLIRNTMPPRATNPLSDQVALNIVTYILQSNGFPAGSWELTRDWARTIQIEGRNGPQPLPSYAAVRVAGCLTKGERNTWSLVSATEPRRTRTPGKMSQEELDEAWNSPAGRLTFQLQNLAILGAFKAEQHEAHWMLVKGALIRDGNGDRLSVTAVEMIADSCN